MHCSRLIQSCQTTTPGIAPMQNGVPKQGRNSVCVCVHIGDDSRSFSEIHASGSERTDARWTSGLLADFVANNSSHTSPSSMTGSENGWEQKHVEHGCRGFDLLRFHSVIDGLIVAIRSGDRNEERPSHMGLCHAQKLPIIARKTKQLKNISRNLHPNVVRSRFANATFATRQHCAGLNQSSSKHEITTAVPLQNKKRK